MPNRKLTWAIIGFVGIILQVIGVLGILALIVGWIAGQAWLSFWKGMLAAIGLITIGQLPVNLSDHHLRKIDSEEES